MPQLSKAPSFMGGNQPRSGGFAAIPNSQGSAMSRYSGRDARPAGQLGAGRSWLKGTVAGQRAPGGHGDTTGPVANLNDPQSLNPSASLVGSSPGNMPGQAPADPAYAQIKQNILNGYGTIADYSTYKNTGKIPQYPGMTPAPSAQAGGGISYEYQPPPTGPHPEAPMPQPSVNPPVQYDYQPQQNGPHPQAPPPTGGYQPQPSVAPGNSQFGHQQGNQNPGRNALRRHFAQQRGGGQTSRPGGRESLRQMFAQRRNAGGWGGRRGG